MVQWYSGTMVQWYNGTMVQWYNGTVVQWYSDTVKHVYIDHSGDLQIMVSINRWSLCSGKTVLI